MMIGRFWFRSFSSVRPEGWAKGKAMRVKVYDLQPGEGGFVLDLDRLYCVITIEDGKGSFKFPNPSREELIRELFDGPSSSFVSGGTTPDGAHWDALESHPAWSAEAIEAIVNDELYGHNLGATIEYEK
jgi:hypothetical protein